MTQYFNMASDKNEVDETSFSEYSTNDEYHSEFGKILTSLLLKMFEFKWNFDCSELFKI